MKSVKKRIDSSLNQAMEQLANKIMEDIGVKPSQTQVSKILGEAIIFAGISNPKNINGKGKTKKGKMPKEITIKFK